MDRASRNAVGANAWSVCIGAGISRGLAPDWKTITQRMLSRGRKAATTTAEMQALTDDLGWSLDSVLQLAFNLYLLDGKTQSDFNDDLSDELYGPVLAAAARAGLRDSLAQLLSNPYKRRKRDVLKLEAFISSTYGSASIMQLARLLIRAASSGRAPTAVMTFNADVLLHSALTLLEVRESFESSGSYQPSFRYRALYRSTDRPNGKIPIHHVHGSITPLQQHREAREKLVFPESGYSEMAATVHSWPQTVFLSVVQSTRVVFVGMSMSDPNIRRWLSWCERYRRSEIAQRTADPPMFLSQHFWVTTASRDPAVQRAKEVGLRHLGVKTAFIPTWDHLEDSLSNLVGL